MAVLADLRSDATADACNPMKTEFESCEGRCEKSAALKEHLAPLLQPRRYECCHKRVHR